MPTAALVLLLLFSRRIGSPKMVDFLCVLLSKKYILLVDMPDQAMQLFLDIIILVRCLPPQC